MKIRKTVETYLRKRLFVALSLFCLITAVAGVGLNRPFWFDEALTITNFLALPNIHDIYWMYIIPNNHILYNILLRFWISLWEIFFPLIEIGFRSFSLFFACLFAYSTWRLWSREFDRLTAYVLVGSFIFSAPFAIYAVAVRGYMMSAFLGIAMLWLSRSLIRKGGWLFILTYFLGSLVMIAVIPSNIIFLGAVCLLNFPVRRVRRHIIRWLTSCALPLIAFFMFYGPILDKFMKAASQTGGWTSGTAAVWHLYGSFAIAFLPLLPFFFLGEVLSLRKRKFNAFIECVLQLLVIAFPLIFFLIRTPAPFPRVFWVFWVIFLYILGKNLYRFRCFLIRKKGKDTAFTVLLAIFCAQLTWTKVCETYRSDLSSLLTPAGQQDDMIEPYFIKNYHPVELVKEVGKLLKRRFFLTIISPIADPPGVLFYANMNGVENQIWLFDHPRKKLEFNMEESPFPIFIIVRDDHDLDQMKKRFHFNKAELIKNFGFHKLYEIKK